MTVGTMDFACYSDDTGKTWQPRKADIQGYTYREHYPWEVFGESVVFNSPTGRLMMLSRMDLAYAEFDPPLPFQQKMPKKTGVDHFDGRELLAPVSGGELFCRHETYVVIAQ